VRTVEVDCYSGHKADERPARLKLPGEILEIAELEDRWYSPGESVFRVKVNNGDRYILRHIEAQDVWSLEGYRSGSASGR
jgi:hypothetical protein